jgi:hypothetical protein
MGYALPSPRGTGKALPSRRSIGMALPSRQGTGMAGVPRRMPGVRRWWPGHARIRSISTRAVSGRMIRGSGSSPRRNCSRNSRPLMETCL